MKRKSLIFIQALIILVAAGCIKETYDLNMLSKQAHVSPTFGVAAARGDISFSDIVKESDTVLFGTDKSVTLVFKKDSVIDLKLTDYYDLNNMVSFNDSYPIGALSLDPFSGYISYTLDEISQRFSTTLRNQFVALNGTTSNFPSFPATDLPEKALTAFSSFDYATFKSGYLDITITNNLTAPLSGVTVKIYNTTGHTQVGGTMTISAIAAGATGTTSLDLTNLTINSGLTAAVSLSGSPGTSTPVLIDLANSNVRITLSGRNMLVKSGKMIIPTQNLTSFDAHDTIPFNPGTDVLIGLIKMNSGNLSYTINSGAPVKSVITLDLPSTNRSGSPISESLTVNPSSTLNGNISVASTTIDLGTRTNHPYNLLPINSTVSVSSTGSKVIFNSTDQIQLSLSFHNPDFDYVKGYFGQKVETIGNDTIDLGIKDVLDRISGSFLLSSPSIKLNYVNSFAIPIQVNLDAKGYKKASVVSLGLSPVTLDYPAAPAERSKNGVYNIDKTNSQLPALVSMPPEKIIFSGSAKMNPQGNTGPMGNYLFGNSRFVGNLEVDVPLEFRLNNLMFADTVDNFLKDSGSGSSGFNPEDFDFLRIDLTADNGFPVGVSVKMVLYKSGTQLHLFTIDATDMLKPAEVDATGKVTAPANSTTSLLIPKDFWTKINNADGIIFNFVMNTSNGGTQDVRLCSDYRINFKAAIVLKPDVKFSLK